MDTRECFVPVPDGYVRSQIARDGYIAYHKIYIFALTFSVEVFYDKNGKRLLSIQNCDACEEPAIAMSSIKRRN